MDFTAPFVVSPRSPKVSGPGAALLELFRRPQTIIDAVIENSRSLGKDPRARFDELSPYLAGLIEERVLVPTVSKKRAKTPRYGNGAAVRGWTIVRCAGVREEGEIYEVRKGAAAAALKIGRATTPEIHALYGNEAAILHHLAGGGIAPRLREAGVRGKRPYLIVDWIDGVDAAEAAARRRHDRASLLGLCTAIATAYAALHARGVLHGDVQARNVLVGDDVMLGGFFHACHTGETPPPRLAGRHFFAAPESIRGPSSAKSEQYAVAALLYLLITGSHYVDFGNDGAAIEHQIEREPPMLFVARGLAPWPEVERILFRALEKDPARRYGSMAAMAAALTEARNRAARRTRATGLSAETKAFLNTTLQSFAPGGAMFEAGYRSPPTASIAVGCAGAAVGLLRIAEARGDAKLLALAGAWSARAHEGIGAGDVGPYYGDTGAHIAAAMVARAAGDLPAQRRAISAFLLASIAPCGTVELMHGRSGTLLTAAILLEISDRMPEAAALRVLGSGVMRRIWRELDEHPPLDAAPRGTMFGMAHGWAGYLYATLRWCAVSGEALPSGFPRRLTEHAALKTRNDRGASWRAVAGRPYHPIPGWCHGSAGQLFLFTLAHRLLGGDHEWLRLAELCAWNTWDENRRRTSLCCGSAGRAYALLNFYKHGGDRVWVSRARHLANHAAAGAAATSPHRNTFWHGELGVAVLIADLESPENARMPFFE